MRKLFAVILSLSLIIGPVPAAKAASGGYGKMIFSLANGIAGTTILTSCKMGASQPSLMIYMAGSLTYIASEIMGGKDKGKQVSENAKKVEEIKAKMKEGGDYQKAIVQAQLDDEKDTLKHIQKRSKWTGLTVTVYKLAAAAAIIEFILSKIPPFKPDIGACTSGTGLLAGKGIETGVVLAYSAANAYAGGGMMGLAGAVAVKLADYALKLGVGRAVTDAAISVLNSGIGRAVTFLAIAVIVGSIKGDLDKQEKETKKHIADLEAILQQFPGASNSIAEGNSTAGADSGSGSTSGSTAGAGTATSTNGAYAIKELSAGVETAKSCFSTSTGKLDYSEAGCKTPITLTRPQFDASLDLPTLKSGANLATDLGQAIANGDMAKADVAGASLNSMAARIDSLTDGLVKKANDQLKKDGQGALDPNAELNRRVAAFNDALNKNQPGSGFDMASFDVKGGDANLSTGDGKASDELKQDIGTAAADNAVAVPAGLDINGLSENGMIGADSLSEGANGNGEDKMASLSDNLNNFESSEGDINPDSDVSIFKQVSNRYLLNYGKIFNKRKEIQPPMAPATPVGK